MNKGITQKVYGTWRRDHGQAQRSVRQLEDSEMHAIYEAGYWSPARCSLPPTEGGSSSNPVFDDRQWQVITLHHMGGKFGMPRLNGVTGSYGANEGLAMRTLVAAAQAELNKSRNDATQAETTK
jgi:lysozyme family protein